MCHAPHRVLPHHGDRVAARAQRAVDIHLRARGRRGGAALTLAFWPVVGIQLLKPSWRITGSDSTPPCTRHIRPPHIKQHVAPAAGSTMQLRTLTWRPPRCWSTSFSSTETCGASISAVRCSCARPGAPPAAALHMAAQQRRRLASSDGHQRAAAVGGVHRSLPWPRAPRSTERMYGYCRCQVVTVCQCGPTRSLALYVGELDAQTQYMQLSNFKQMVNRPPQHFAADLPSAV